MSLGDRAGPFSRSRLTFKSLKLSVKLSMYSHERAGWFGFSRSRFFRPGISVSGQENVAILTLQFGYREESGINFSNEFCIVLLYMLYFPHHKHPI